MVNKESIWEQKTPYECNGINMGSVEEVATKKLFETVEF